MSRSGPPAPLGATGRADLLRALALRDRTQLTLDHDADGWFGYVRVRAPGAEAGKPITVAIPRTAPATASAPVCKPPLQMPFVPMIVRREAREPPAAETQAPAVASAPLAPEDDPAAAAPSPVRLIGYEDLVPKARLLPALRRHLGATRAGPLDLDRLIQRLAASELPRHLPRRCLQRWHPELVVVLDFCARLWPYREDMHRLAERLLRQCGRSGVSLRIVNHGPLGPWSDWLAHQNRQLKSLPRDDPWRMPPAGTPVLLVGDLGLLAGPDSAPCRAWARFIDGLRCAQVRPVALVPLGAEQLHAPLTTRLPVLRWSPDAPAHPVRAHGEGTPQPDGLDDLLAMVAATRRADPPLLREMRRLNPRAPLNAGLEGALWCHADVEAGMVATIRTDAHEPHLRRFGELAPGLQAALDARRHRHHAHLRAVVNHEETLLWAAHAGAAALDSPEAQERIEAARQFMGRLAAMLAQPDGLRVAGVWWDVANGIVQRADARMAERYGAALYPLLENVIRAQDGQGRVPAWADPARVSGLFGDQDALGWLVRDAASGWLLMQAVPAGPRQSALGAPLRLDGGVRVHIRGAAGAYLLSGRTLPMRLARLDAEVELHLLTAHESLTVAAVQRPRSALGWSVSSQGIRITAAGVGGADVEWTDAQLLCTRESSGSGEQPKWRIATPAEESGKTGARVSYGIDARYGVYADLHIETSHARAIQRLRWIEPGTFLMGSLANEPERFNNEGPQHLVTLTHGFWLADTACTQALWRAVMGNDPSHFKDDANCPVEQVSWDDVQKFLHTLEALLPGCGAALPTEAQWEYACRAGTTTPFSFGEQITPAQVNYDGDYPYAGGNKGEYRARTVPVKSLPANDWGLYEMHGNVWEWCADGLRSYDDAPQQDPEGPADSAHRAVRGGSWCIDAGYARSAFRNDDDPGFALDYLGFRLCLRSPGLVRPGGPDGPQRPEGVAVTAPVRDAPVPSLAQRAKEFFSRSGKSGGNRKK